MKNLIQVLSLPVNESETLEGWNAKSKAAIKVWLVQTLAKISQGESIPEADIATGLTAWGVNGGLLFNEVTEVLNELGTLASARH